MQNPTSARWAGRGALATVAVAAAVATAGPSAAETTPAAPTSITVSSSTLYVNQTYTVTVHCQARTTVAVAVDLDPYDAQSASQLLGGDNIARGPDLLATVQWTPTTTGAHTIEAYGCTSGGGWPGNRPPTATLAVTVGTAPTSSGSAEGIPIIGPLLSKLFG